MISKISFFVVMMSWVCLAQAFSVSADPGGYFENQKQVSMTASDPGIRIFYTLDGSVPLFKITNSEMVPEGTTLEYSGPFTLRESVLLRYTPVRFKDYKLEEGISDTRLYYTKSTFRYCPKPADLAFSDYVLLAGSFNAWRTTGDVDVMKKVPGASKKVCFEIRKKLNVLKRATYKFVHVKKVCQGGEDCFRWVRDPGAKTDNSAFQNSIYEDIFSRLGKKLDVGKVFIPMLAWHKPELGTYLDTVRGKLRIKVLAVKGNVKHIRMHTGDGKKMDMVKSPFPSSRNGFPVDEFYADIEMISREAYQYYFSIGTEDGSFVNTGPSGNADENLGKEGFFRICNVANPAEKKCRFNVSQKNGDINGSPVEFVPAWARNAIWYQVFPERFRNGDVSNDEGGKIPDWMTDMVPRLKFMRPPLIPWTEDWFYTFPYEQVIIRLTGKSPRPMNLYHDVIYIRRYGGDLQGVLNKVDYLKSLGVTAVYFNPLCRAVSLHKYDCNDYRHVDPHFGPMKRVENPDSTTRPVLLDRDVEKLNSEKLTDASSWKWTEADRLFLKTVKAFHRAGIKVIVDTVYNHTGTGTAMFQDLVKNGKDSDFVDWYDVRFPGEEGFDQFTCKAPGGKFHYRGWAGFCDLPCFRQEDGEFDSDLQDYLIAVSKRWLKPNIEMDGEPADGVDGYRLDVYNLVNAKFWKTWRKELKKVNGNVFIVAEEWEDASSILKGDQVDSVMNYLFTKLVHTFFVFPSNKRISASEFHTEAMGILSKYRSQVNMALQNLLTSHDTDRIASRIKGKNRAHPFKVDWRKNVYSQNRPTKNEKRELYNLITFQFTFPGSPMVYYGDEVGMWGGDDPTDRKPMVWDDLGKYTHESRWYNSDKDPFKHHINRWLQERKGRRYRREKRRCVRAERCFRVEQDKSLFKHHKKLIAMKKDMEELRDGDYVPVESGHREVLAFLRRIPGKDPVLVVINHSTSLRALKIKFDGYDRKKNYSDVLKMPGTRLGKYRDYLRVSLRKFSSSIIQ